MRTLLTLTLTIFTFFATAFFASAQDKSRQLSDEDIAKIERLFDTANSLMEQHKYAEALLGYQEALAIEPDAKGPLFNGGLAAYQSKNFAVATELWLRLKSLDSADWHVRAKLVQTYQALGKITELKQEREDLFRMWKAGDNAELSKRVNYCREQFEVGKFKVMAFEHFELTGERALRYVFSIPNEKGEGEEFRISLGSYDLTNSIWLETTKSKPKPGERLFHLDGYFKWGHATYGMYPPPEPSYDQVRDQVIKILEGRANAASSSTVSPAVKEPAQKPKP